MIAYYELYDTKEEAEAFRDRVYNSYHPLGYGTHIRIDYDADRKKWIAHGGRAESCD